MGLTTYTPPRRDYRTALGAQTWEVWDFEVCSVCLETGELQLGTHTMLSGVGANSDHDVIAGTTKLCDLCSPFDTKMFVEMVRHGTIKLFVPRRGIDFRCEECGCQSGGYSECCVWRCAVCDYFE